jgi:hypothetical protein
MTNEPTFQIAAITAELVDDGDKVELDDGAVVTLRVVPDECTTYQDTDADGDGCVAMVKHDRWDNRAMPRPAGFNGAARKLSLRDGSVWWQPPVDVLAMGTDAVRTLAQYVRDRLEYGYVGMIVEITGPNVDAYGRPIVMGAASIWGCDSVIPEYVSDLVADAIAQAYPNGGE